MNRKICIVDDEPLVALSLERAFAMKGYSVLKFSSAKEALEKWNQFLPDLALIDVLMPEMTGPELIEALRQQELSCKIILMSAYSGSYDLLADGFIAKPFADIFAVVTYAQEVLER